MTVQQRIQVEFRIVGQLVHIELLGSEESLRWAMGHCSDVLTDLVDGEVLKWCRTRADHFLLMPQSTWTPTEVVVEIKRLLQL